MGKLDDAKLVKGLVPGTSTDTFVLGDRSDAEQIAARALEVAARFSDAVIRQDLDAAYGCCADEWKKSADLKKFVAQLRKSDNTYGGPPTAWSPERITWIYAEPRWREDNNKEGDWPKDTPKQHKRALLSGWWSSAGEGDGDTGRSVFFWITEQPDGYRIAKLKQYQQ